MHWKKITWLLMTSMVSTAMADSKLLDQTREWEAKQAKAETMLAGYPLGKAIQYSDPVSFAMLVDTLARRISQPKQQHLLQNEMYLLINEIVRTKLLAADDEDVNWFFSSELFVMQQAQKKDPIGCGKVVITQGDMSAEFLPQLPSQYVEERTTKLASVIARVGVKQARQHDMAKAEQAMTDVMTTLYSIYGSKLDQFGQYTGDKLMLIEQCRMALDMFKSISLLPEQRKANLYRAMLQQSTKNGSKGN